MAIKVLSLLVFLIPSRVGESGGSQGECFSGLTSESFCLFFHPSPLPSFPSRVWFLFQCLELIFTVMVPDLCKQSLSG